MLLLATALIACSTSGQQFVAPIQFTSGLAISGVATGGRVPVFFDSVLDQVVHGTWLMPKEGDSVPTPRGGTAKWKVVKAGKDGNFPELPPGYVAVSADVTNTRVMLLEASGPSMVYVNGVPRAGDPYGYGYLKLPVILKQGSNTFLFSVQRGALQAKLSQPKASIQIETGDLTTPDIVVDGTRKLLAGIVVLNNTLKTQKVRLVVTNAKGNSGSVESEILPLTLRKMAARIVVPDGDLGAKQEFSVKATSGKLEDVSNITLQVKKKTDVHKETFVSDIDGSVQYYGVNPSQKPSRKDALVLSLHGASVEAIGQAAAYGSKDWCTLVAATNRRPYGFDWEDIGRLDALEVLELAKKRFPHEANHVHLTGHSMGGHGTWSIGTLYPDLFASIAPSAGWVSFMSYAGGYVPSNPSKVELILKRAMAPSDTLARVANTLEQKVYIVHGDADDNVPVTEARTMKKALSEIHADFKYHEQPGAGHWWGLPNMSGAACVDWPGIFDQIRESRIPRRSAVNFTTPNPAVSSHDQWLTILQQQRPMIPSNVQIDDHTGSTANVEALKLDREFQDLKLDGQDLGHVWAGTTFVKESNRWVVEGLNDGARNPNLSGPFKNVYQNRVLFVVGTKGTPEENDWALSKAKYDAEMYQYRGNASVDIVADTAYRPTWQRNIVLYGNADTNDAWKKVLANCPIRFGRGSAKVGNRLIVGPDLAGLLIYPFKADGRWIMVGAVTGSGIEGLRTTDRLPVFTSGVAYPDWIICGSDVTRLGAKGIRGCGFYSNNWNLSPIDTAWN